MNDFSINNREENKDKLKSGIITAIIWSVLLLFVFLYKITEKIQPKQEVITKMLINFGDKRNGNGKEEPANQEGSLAAKATPNALEVPAETKPQPKTEVKPVVTTAEKKEIAKEKIITGNSPKNSVKSAEKIIKTSSKPKTATSASKTSGSKATTAHSKTGNGDGKGTAAIGNLIKGRGTKPGTQGTNGLIGNQGDPLGGDGNGDSIIGVDRKLTSFIPGTMGRGGAQPSHNCKASGNISIAYIVDKAGNITSAKRSSGVSDPCVVSTSIDWVKKYVKAEKSTTVSTGTYKITF